jgi:hypothetical protein
MSAPGATWRDGKPSYGPRHQITLILGPATCPTCLNQVASRLHHEICEVNA